MIRFWRGVVLPCSVAVLLAGCFSDECKVPPLLERPVEIADIVVGGSGADDRPFGIDVCIDATPSMEGFAAPETSIYRSFLEDLESSLTLGRRVTSLRYYKFGERIREIPREEFRSARTRAFYNEPGIFRTTNIELVFSTGAPAPRQQPQLASAASGTGARAQSGKRLIVVVTDLFQRDQDMNAVVQQIRRRCLSDPACSVALLPIPSQFDGKVYDARVPSYRYRSTTNPSTFRPFYLLMFGPEAELRRFGEVLSGLSYIDTRNFTVIGRRVVSGFSAGVSMTKGSKGVTPRKTCDIPHSAYVNLRQGFGRAAIQAALRIRPDAHSFGFRLEQATVRAFRESNGKLLPARGEVAAKITPAKDGLEVATSIHPPAPKGDYLYVFEVVTGDVNGFVLPAWVAGLSSPDPRPDRDPAKTLNLDRFVGQLIATSLSDRHQPRLARFRVLIHKL